MRRCQDCSYYSASHSACFEPSTWSHGEYFRVPGDPQMINRDGKCRLYEPTVQPVGLSMLWFRFRNFLRRIK
jgi:hypothetical protein